MISFRVLLKSFRSVSLIKNTVQSYIQALLSVFGVTDESHVEDI